jgi:molecular chaperone DnaJ
MAEDLYAELELNKQASEADIKKAYRRLARKYHPDVNKDAGAEDKFKKIQKAYAILSDPQKKAQYDQFGIADDSAQGAGFGGFSGFGGGFESTFEDIFETFFGGAQGGGRSRRTGPRRGDDLRYDLELTLEEVAEGIAKEVDVFHMEKCEECKGVGAAKGEGMRTCEHCNGQGQIKTVQRTMLGSFSQISTCPHCQGSGQVIKNPCRHCHGRGVEKKKKKIKIEVPAGVDGGTKLRVAGEGNQGENGGPKGDLYVFLNVREHKYFQRDGADVFLEIHLPVTKAILGDEVKVPILGGSALLKIPPGTQPDMVFRMKGKGIINFRGFGRGDQYVKVKVEIPEKLSDKERELIKEFARLRKEEKRDSSNIFEYVKKLF